MKTIICIFLSLFVSIRVLLAQEIFAEIKIERCPTEVKFDWDEPISYDAHSTEKVIYNFSIGISSQVYKNFYLKTTIGSNDYEESLSVSWEENGNEYDLLLSTISINQNFFELLPEVRLTKNKIIFLNMGIGFCQMRDSKFLFGSYRRNNKAITDKSDFPNFEGRFEYFVMNAGLHLQYKGIGVLGELGLRDSSFTGKKATLPGIGIKQITAKIGLVYQLN